MHPFVQLKKATPVFLIALLLMCFGLLPPKAFGVVPAPDGGYPGGNTAEGANALLSLTTGGFNTAVGYLSLRSSTDGSFNTATGAGALFANTADENTATGAAALLSNTTGPYNTANGAFALFSNTTGNGNTADGDRALYKNTTGSSNTANGAFALFSNTVSAYNTAIGTYALMSNTGFGAANTAVGWSALRSSTSGSFNTALGAGAGSGVTTADNVICIGSAGADVSQTTWIGNIYGVTTQSGTTAPVIVSDTGQLGTMASSERFKKDIAAMDAASEAILSLRPVTFHYKRDTKETPQFGLIAEEVAKVNPALVLPDKAGKPYTVRYDQVNAMLLNEFLKEHRKVEEQAATITNLRSAMAQQRKDFEAAIAQQRKTTEAVVARLDEQAAQIRKVSAQIEATKAAPQMVLNNP
jgi:hypothetical protein